MGVISIIAEWLFPVECVICKKSDKWLCKECYKDIEFLPLNKCPFCKSFSFLSKTCKKCVAIEQNKLDGVFSYSSYKNLKLKKVIHSYKYSYITDLKYPLFRLLEHILKNIEKGQAIGNLSKIIDEKTLFFYVPLHNIKLRTRGFNQAELLLEELVKNKIVTEKQAEYKDFLKRIKNTLPQAKLKKEEKTKNLKDAFSYKGPLLKNKNVILIDDVATTGSTLNECAKILKSVGAKKVYGMVIAR
ncbi:ComF family protein [Candidatus Falkowbacteria bacterium]|jgi:competence protein ComFC|nr:ComF family protein [Candidatus Falkowbacteria bacterium]MBT4433387.1 ComF family protein [Candidatus Falkowbacteria bacterium]